jgi:TolB-like protein/Flp pilus assembly protein TadD
MSEKPVYTFGPFCLDAEERVLLRNGGHVSLAPKAFATLLLLVEKSGHVVEKCELMQAVWPDTFVEESNLAQNIFRLRKMLREGGGRDYIETVPRRGYRFVGDVRESSEAGSEVESGRRAAPELTQAGDKDISSVAVLPFANDSNNPKLAYLSDGLAESIINNLSRLTSLKVMARSTTFRYRGPEVEAWKVGRMLNVGAVLTGRVYKFGRNIVVGAELVNVTDGSQVWGEKYQRPVSNILVLQEEIAKNVAATLRLKLSIEDKRRLEKRHTNDAEAYLLYLKGRYFWGRRTAAWLRKSVQYFRRAIEADDRYALAYAGLADAYNLLCGYSVLSPAEAFPRAKEAALKALELDETLAEAHTSLAHIIMPFEWDWAAAEREYRRAIELDPNCSASHHWYSVYLRIMGRFDEALAELQTALELEPLSLIINAALGTHFHLARQPALAIEQLSKTIELDANFPYAYFIRGLAYEQAGRHKEAVAELRKAVRLSDNPEYLSRLGCAHASSKRRGEARAILRKLNELRKRKYVAGYDLAALHTALGENDLAFAWLETALAERDETLCLLGIDPILDNLRSDPRFTELLSRVGLPLEPASRGWSPGGTACPVMPRPRRRGSLK